MIHEFQVAFHSFEDVREFVFLSMRKPFEITVSTPRQCVDGKSLMIMFSLDYSQPLKVGANCTEEEFLHFKEAAARFVV